MQRADKTIRNCAIAGWLVNVASTCGHTDAPLGSPYMFGALIGATVSGCLLGAAVGWTIKRLSR